MTRLIRRSARTSAYPVYGDILTKFLSTGDEHTHGYPKEAEKDWAGETGGREDISLGDLITLNQLDRRRLKNDFPCGERFPLLHRLVGDIDHRCFAPGVNMS